MAELAELFEVHVRTVQAWHKAGLTPNNSNNRPLLFRGDIIKAFHTKRRDRGRHKLRPGEFYCPRCHEPRRPRPDSVTFEVTNKRVGKTALQVMIRASCQTCGCHLNLISTDKYLERQREQMNPVQHQRGLECGQLGFVFTDLKAG